jgi:hypothetical protein
LFIERDKIDTHNKHIHDCSFSWFGRDTSIKSGSVKLVIWTKTSHLREMMDKNVPS